MLQATSVVVSRRLRRATMVSVSAAALLACSGHAMGQVHPSPQWGIYGSNVQILRDPIFRFGPGAGFILNGAGINLGQVEGGRAGDPDVTYPNPGGGPPANLPEVAHPAINPGGAGTIGVTDLNAGPPVVAGVQLANTFTSFTFNDPNPPPPRFVLGDHPTQVAGVMVANGAIPAGLPAGTQGVVGVAPASTIWCGNFNRNGVASDVGAVVATEWVRARGAVAINMSFGLNPGANPVNGQSLLSRYVDWTVNTNNHAVVVAGNEDPAGLLANNGGNPRIYPSDTFNSIVVGATTQRASGNDVRFDQVANWNSPNYIDVPKVGGGTYRLGKTDVLAPGGSSFSYTLRNTVTLVERTWSDFNNYTPGANEVIVAGSFNPVSNTSDVYMPTIFPAGAAGNLGSPGFTTAGGTSFAAPQVNGIIGLMQQYQTAVRGQVQLEAIDAKASLLNSASKHVMSMDVAAAGSPTAVVGSGQAWPTRYRARTANASNFAESLDPEMGTGQANALGAVRQIASGNGDTRFGSKLNDVSAGGTNTLMLNAGYGTLTAGSLVTATLVWNRNVTNPNVAANNGDLIAAGQYNSPNLPNDLDLRLVNRSTGAVIAASQSFYAATEHIYFNVPADGDYNLEVRNVSGQSQHYAIAYATGSSDGMTFTTARGYTNPSQATGVMAGFANNAFPNDVNALGYAGQGQYEIGGELFSSDLTGTNQQRLSGALATDSRVGPHIGAPAAMNLLTGQRGVLGLTSGDQISGLSFGRDGTNLQNSVVTFSVDPTSVGNPGTDVNFQAVLSPPAGPASQPGPTNPGGGAPGHEAAGDIFVTPALQPFGVYNSAPLAPAMPGNNRLHIDESKLGLQAPAANGGVQAPEDNLTDFDHDNIRSYVDTDGDGIHNKQIFFSLAKNSPSLITFGNTGSANVFVSQGSDTGGANIFNVFAPFNTIGLGGFDGIDSLIISDWGPNGLPDGILEPGFDEMLFSLDRNSVSGNAVDIYYTNFTGIFQLYANGAYLGLNGIDNIDGLDIWTIPAPGSGTLLVFLGVVGARRRRREP